MTLHRRIPRRPLLAAAAAGLPLAGSRAASAQTAPVTWTAYSFAPSAQLTPYKHLEAMVQRIEQATNGALRIRPNVGGSLPINTQNIAQATGDGVVQMADDGFFVGAIPVGGVLRLPMLINSREEAERAGAAVRPALERAYKRRGCVLLSHYWFPAQVIWGTRPIASLDDLRGLKLRVTSPEQGEFIRRFGGTAITIGGPEVPSALQSGAVEGVLTASVGGGRIWKDLLRSSYRLAVNYFDAFFIANDEAFNRLPRATQELLRREAQSTAQAITEEHFREEDEFTRQLAAGGITMTEPKPEDIARARERLAPFWDEWGQRQQADTREALAAARRALSR
ncbi:MAG: TRAP transporter substrate-binding protein DctP [Acetobacteraceae bacterium]|nr:TRAP transporter substrate-binding protein DctP [Acetobacteraceae bacterium]